MRENRRSWKCLEVSHHRNDYKRADAASCSKCKENHFRSLYNETKNEPLHSKLSPHAPTFTSQAPTFTSQGTPPEVENCNIRGRDNEETKDANYFPGIYPVLKVRSEAATEHSATYLPCRTKARTRVSYSKELQNNWEYAVCIRTCP